ncbi:MAG TPA: GNAT family N-acetyltransferase [Candidatus Cybelea sp.]|nr:GNAT family N-acetyltransferase [Candidatus Cybelea sp.]
MNFRVRLAIPEDIVAIAEVQIASWRGAYRGVIADETLERLDIAHQAIQWQRAMDRKVPVWVAVSEIEGEDQVVGFASLRENEITVLYVAPDWQRRGVGTALLRAVLDAIAVAGGTLGWLWVLEANAAARAFYAAAGGRAADDGPVRVGQQELRQVRYLWDLPLA